VYMYLGRLTVERLIVILLVPVLELEREACFTWYEQYSNKVNFSYGV
jgi:hypothetical protein